MPSARGLVEQGQHLAPQVGRLSGWFRLTLTVGPVRRASSCIHGHSPVGTSTWSGANWNTPCPARRSASAIPSSSSASAFVPGTSSPDFDRWIGVRDVENPSAPARSPRSTIVGHRLDVGGGRRLVGRAPLAHHVAAHRPVGDLGADVDRVRPGVEGVEVLLERLPVPR